MTYTERFAAGIEFEEQLAAWLIEREWHVQEIGQGSIKEPTRARLKQLGSPITKLPDFIASKRIRGGPHVAALIDAKGRHPDTPPDTGRHSVEIASAQFLARFSVLTNLPLFLVFDDLCLSTPQMLKDHGAPGPIRPDSAGSKRPYLLIECARIPNAPDIL